MEALIFIALVVIIILLFKIRSYQKETATRTHQSFLSLKKELLEIKENAANTAQTEGPVKATDETVVQWRPSAPALVPVPVKPIAPRAEQTLPLNEQGTGAPALSPNTIAEKDEKPTAYKQAEKAAQPVPDKGMWSKWLDNNPDLERFIGENLINKIGITILVLGVAFFVKYAIDQDWIKEAGRVSIGVGCGIVLTLLAHYLRNSYRSFSSVLAGGGIAIFYFTIAFAFHQYQLFSQTAAFIIMVVITIFAVILSLLYNKPELAIIAAIGGFVTPFLVSSGNGNYIILFSYLLILNGGMLTLAWFKQWRAINLISLFFTICIYGGWLIKNTALGETFPMYGNSFLFATAFYVLFLGMGMIYNLRTRATFKTFDFSLLMLITFSYYTAGMTNLHYWHEGLYQGLFTITLGLINFVIALFLYKTNKGDKNLLYLFIGLTLTFISLAAPVQLHGHTITLFWSAEFVLLYWLHQRSSIRIFKYSSGIILVLMLISLLIDWNKANDYTGEHLLLIFKDLRGFTANIMAVAAFTSYAILLRRERNTTSWIAGINNKPASTLMILAGCIILYLTCIFGANLYFYNYQPAYTPNAWHQLITYSFTGLLLWLLNKYDLRLPAQFRTIITGTCVVLYLLSISLSIRLRNGVLQNEYPSIQLAVHWLADVAFLCLLYDTIQSYRKKPSAFILPRSTFIWVVNIILITFLSIECMHAYIFITAHFQDINISRQQYSKAGLTILWAICSFIVMWLGMKHKFKTLRIISLVLFSLTLVKLFLFDIRNISEGGKIAAFIVLGVLLLIISFMYQKLKKIIIDDSVH